MPFQTPDASAFIRQKKLNAIQERNINDVKYLTHLYAYVPTTRGINDFLPSTNKTTQPLVPGRKGVSNGGKITAYVRPKYIR